MQGNGLIKKHGGQYGIVVIGASAGGVEALQRVVSELPADFPAAVLIVLHVSPRSRSLLPQILSDAGCSRGKRNAHRAGPYLCGAAGSPPGGRAGPPAPGPRP
jgi:hypothetical protein